MTDPIQDIARQLGITTFGDGLLTKIRETIDLLQSDANNLMQYKEVAAELEAELAALKADNQNYKNLHDWLKSEYDQLKAKTAVPDRMAVPKPIWRDVRHLYGDPLNAANIRGAEMFNLAIDEVLRLNRAVAPAQPQSDCVRVPRELLVRIERYFSGFTCDEPVDVALGDGGISKLRALLGGSHDPAL